MCSKVLSICLQVLCLVSVSIASTQQSESVKFSDFTSWSCLNNASCMKDLATRVAKQLSNKEAVDLDIFRIQPIEPKTTVVEGRAKSSLSFLDRNALQFPIGPFVINLERSDSKKGNFQVSLMTQNEARSMDEARFRRKDRLRTRTMILPFLAMNSIGWLLFAIMAVKVLTVKAFMVAKLAFILSSVLTVKRFLESAVERAAPHLMNHPEFLPFNSVEMDGGFPAGSDIMPYHLGSSGPSPFPNSLVAESNINAVVEANNSTSAVAPKLPAKIKRQDVVGNQKNLYYNYVAQRNPIYAYRQF